MILVFVLDDDDGADADVDAVVDLLSFLYYFDTKTIIIKILKRSKWTSRRVRPRRVNDKQFYGLH